MTGAVQRWLRCVPWALPAVVAVAAVTAAVVAVVCWWDWLRSVPESSDSGGETLRTLALILVAIAGLFFAWWRNRIAGRQAETANEQAKTANRQAETANRQAETAAHGLRNERYQKGADMLGNATLATRLGGIYALEQLAREHPEEYHVQIVRLLCSFIRHPAEAGRPESGGTDGGGLDDPAHEAEPRCAPHIEAAAQAIGRRRVENDPSEFVLNLRGARLEGANLEGAVLSGAILEGANLEGANLEGAQLSDAILRTDAILRGANLEGAILWDADLSGADLSGADLSGAIRSGAILWDTNLSGADLSGANLSGADLSGAIRSGANLSGANLEVVKGLKQSGLDKAFIRRGEAPPLLEDALDPVTGEPLVWQGEERPPEDEDED